MIKEINNYRINFQHLKKDTIIYKSKVFHSIKRLEFTKIV